MSPIEDMPSILVKSASRDARVSCETLSHLESPHRPEDAGAGKWKSDEDDDDDDDRSSFGATDVEVDYGDKVHAGSKSSHSGKRFFACFSPARALHILPRPMMSPGRRGSDFTAIHRAAVPYSGPLTHSAPLGSIPHSGPMKIGGGSMVGHQAPMKVVPKGHSGPFTMMPADVVGKKKPPGYESDEPTSPEVTCIGRVRIKHKHWENAMEENGFKERMKGKWPKKPHSKGKEKKELESIRRWKWPFATRKEAKNMSPIQEQNAELDLRRFGSSSVVSPTHEKQNDREEFPLKEESKKVDERKEAPASNVLLLMKGGSRNREASNERGPLTEESNQEGEAPPPNVLLLMKGGSRNWDRPNERGLTPAEETALTVTPIFAHTKNEAQFKEETAVLVRGNSKSMDRQNSLDEQKGSIWKRRSFVKPCTLDVKKDSRVEVVRKHPMTT